MDQHQPPHHTPMPPDKRERFAALLALAAGLIGDAATLLDASGGPCGGCGAQVRANVYQYRAIVQLQAQARKLLDFAGDGWGAEPDVAIEAMPPQVALHLLHGHDAGACAEERGRPMNGCKLLRQLLGPPPAAGA